MYAESRNPIFRRRWFAAVFVCALTDVSSQSAIRAELQGEFHERMNPEVVVSGSIVVGVSSGALFDGASLAHLAIYPAPGLSSVCLTVQSRDGVYTSRNEYRIPASVHSGTPVLLPYDRSRYLGELAQYSDHALALKATPYACTRINDAGEVLPLQRADAPNAKVLRFYVNAINATDVYISTGRAQGECRPVDGRQTSFDHLCEIALPSDAHSGVGVPIRIERERYGRELPAAQVVIRGAAAQ